MGNKVHRNSLKPGYELHWYTIKEILGQGGFGITYLSHDKNLKQDVAIKEYLPIELAVREGDASIHPVSEHHGKQYTWGLDRFITEAQTLAKFIHPNIVRVFSVFEENNTAYMVMAYEQGQSLQQKLTGKKTMEEAELLKILIPILGGLELVHEAGFIHRDIKPDNIFIRQDGSPVLLDFGSARQALGEQTKTLTSLVTPGYAPFEQYYSKSDEQGPWTDIYGLGATLYRAMSGIAPMDAVDRSKSILQGSQDIFVQALEIGQGKYSARFLKAIDHALKFKQTDRPQSIRAWKREFGVKGDIDEIKRIEEIERTPTQPGTHVIKQPALRLRPVSVLLFLLFIISAIGFYYQDKVKDLIASFLPETSEPALVEVGPTAEEIALKEQQAQAQAQAARLKQEQAITKLLKLAAEDFNAGRLIDPPGVNALEHYLNVLKIEPDNAAALAGKQNIFDHYIESAETFIKGQQFEEADRALLQADITEPDSREVKLARLRLNSAEAKAERTAIEDERIRLQEEQKRLAEEQKLKAEEEQKRKVEEEKQLAEQEKRRQQEEQKLQAEAEQKRKAEEARLAELERQRQEEEARKKAEQEKIDKYNSLITKADQAMSDKDKVLAISTYNEILASYPGDAVAKSGIKEAETFKHKVCYDVLGKWMYQGQLSVDIKDGGIYDTPSVGQGAWKCTNPENRTIELQIPLATMTAVLSDDGYCLNATTWAGKAIFNRSGHVCEETRTKEQSTSPAPFKI
jgi:serine/threonine protein kinase